MAFNLCQKRNRNQFVTANNCSVNYFLYISFDSFETSLASSNKIQCKTPNLNAEFQCFSITIPGLFTLYQFSTEMHWNLISIYTYKS